MNRKDILKENDISLFFWFPKQFNTTYLLHKTINISNIIKFYSLANLFKSSIKFIEIGVVKVTKTERRQLKTIGAWYLKLKI